MHRPRFSGPFRFDVRVTHPVSTPGRGTSSVFGQHNGRSPVGHSDWHMSLITIRRSKLKWFLNQLFKSCIIQRDALGAQRLMAACSAH
jgi:hypothetical protein